MASIVDIAPSLGHGVVTAQEGATLGYDAIDDRRFWGVGKQEGVLPTPGAWKVTPGASGLTVEVAADVDGALVEGDAVSAQGLYYVAPHAAPVTLDLDPADPSNPRNDLVVLEVKDTSHDASGLSVARLRVVKGTPNASAARTDDFGVNGTPAKPDSAFCAAVVNVPAGASSIAAGNILDRRPHALGAYVRILDAPLPSGGPAYLTTSTAHALISSTALQPRIECSGAPLRMTLHTFFTHNTSGQHVAFAPFIDGAHVDSLPTPDDPLVTWANGGYVPVTLSWDLVPSPGSHRIGPAWRTSGGTASLVHDAGRPLRLVIEELAGRESESND